MLIQEEALILEELTEEQKQFVLSNWSKMDFLSLVRETFENKKLNGRSKEAKNVQKFLADRKLKKKNETPEIFLTDDQKEYVENSIGTLTPHEIGKIIFENSRLEPLSKEVAIINTYVKTLDKTVARFPHEDYATSDYRPPDQLSAVVTRINIYLRKKLSLASMPTIQKKAVEAVRDFLHAPRFLQTINSYISPKTREMFEGEFVRSVFDKPDLTPDELNIVITLCQHYVMGVTLHKHLNLLNIKYEEILNDSDQKLTVPLAEMIKAKSTELEKCNKAQTDLTKFLSGERSRRREKQGGGQASMARLIEWFRDEEERDEALQRAEMQAKEDEEEVERLENIPENKARILGLSRSELLNG